VREDHRVVLLAQAVDLGKQVETGEVFSRLNGHSCILVPSAAEMAPTAPGIKDGYARSHGKTRRQEGVHGPFGPRRSGEDLFGGAHAQRAVGDEVRHDLH